MSDSTAVTTETPNADSPNVFNRFQHEWLAREFNRIHDRIDAVLGMTPASAERFEAMAPVAQTVTPQPEMGEQTGLTTSALEPQAAPEQSEPSHEAELVRDLNAE